MAAVEDVEDKVAAKVKEERQSEITGMRSQQPETTVTTRTKIAPVLDTDSGEGV